MIKRLIGILRFLVALLHTKIDPNGYARSLGVRMGHNVRFYGMTPGMFSTEPWLINMGDNVYITAGCQFITHDGATLILRKEIPDLELTAPITIGSDVYIGLFTTILPGVKIGNRVIIGACSVVTKDIPDNSVAAGVPARVLKSVDTYLEQAKLKSLHLGHLTGKAKEGALKRHFGISH